MEEFEVDGLVLRETAVGESDKLLTVLTGDRGKLMVQARGVAGNRSRYTSSAQPFTYSTFQLRKRGRYYYIRDAFYQESFEGLRYDLEKLSLASYICDVAGDFSQEGLEDAELLTLTLNTLYALSSKNIPPALLKGAFEFRAAVQAGWMPDLHGCGVCGKEPAGECALDVMNGRILCKDCRTAVENDPAWYGENGAKILIRMTQPVLASLRYIETAEQKKYLSFSLDRSEQDLFAVVCERYLLNHVEHGFSSLEYYKKIRQ